MSNDIANALAQVDLAIKTGIGISIQKDLSRIASESALKAELKEREHAYIPSSGDGVLRDEVDFLAQKVRKLEAEIVSRDMMIWDWMHSNEAFKRLQKNYGNKLGVTDEQRQSNFEKAVLDISEEDPKFANTNFVKGFKDFVKRSPSSGNSQYRRRGPKVREHQLVTNSKCAPKKSR